MKSIIFYTVLLLAIEYGLGYGLARRILPKSLIKYALLMGPWVLNVILIILLVITSLLKIPAGPVSMIAFVVLLCLTLLERKNIKLSKTELLILGVVGTSVLMNIAPLLLRERFLTSISLGNNDIITYAINADYLVNNSIAESFREPVTLTIANLLHDGFRWGPPLLQAFFLTLTRTESWQITYLMQIIFFATMVPLLYIVYQRWYDKNNLSWWVVVLGAFNANLLYMLYHNFYGQVVYWGIFVIIIILATEYYRKSNKRLEWLVGAGIAAMYMTYHEGATFVLVPIIITSLARYNWRGLLRIAAIASLLSSLSIMNATIFDFGQAFRGNPNQPIGWEIFRTQAAISNPLEIAGLASVHTDAPLSSLPAWGLSLVIIGFWSWGIKMSKARGYTLTMMVFFILMLLWSSLGKNGNWYVFNRALTYMLPVMLVVLAGGILTLLKNYSRYVVVVMVSIAVVITGLKLNRKLINSHLSVQKSYSSLREIRDRDIAESIYTTGMISEGVSIWDQIWIGYFLYPHVNDGTIPTTKIEDGSLILLNKSTPWINYPNYLTSETQWESEYYKLARACLSDECLSNFPGDLSYIIFGESEWEDNLLLWGWSIPERDGRWASGLESSLRLFTKENASVLSISAVGLSDPQELNVEIDGLELGKQAIGTTKQEYQFQLPTPLLQGIHKIKFKFAHTYQPSTVLGNQDRRELAVRFFLIKLD